MHIHINACAPISNVMAANKNTQLVIKKKAIEPNNDEPKIEIGLFLLVSSF
jgi:hypothetical protein